MDNQEVQKLLDDLDAQLAAGKIDLPTYQELTRKWTARIGDTLTQPRAEHRVAPAAALKIACPNCGAPLTEALSPQRQSYKCKFCSHTFTLTMAEEQTERLASELRDWLTRLVSAAVPGRGVIDASSRAFLFREKLYPSLQMEFNRALELIEGFNHFPLFQVELGAEFPDYTFEESPLLAERLQLVPIRKLSGRLGAPAVREFVVSAEDDQKLVSMECKANELIFMANIIEQGRKFTAEGYTASRQNVIALKGLYSQIQGAASHPGESQFRQACLIRLEAAAIVLDVLSRIYSTSTAQFMGSAYSQELEGASHYYQEALLAAEGSGYSPMEVVPWEQGVEKEIHLLDLESTVLNCYDRIAVNKGADFLQFQAAIKDFVQQASIPLIDPKTLGILIDQLTNITEATRGSKGLPRVLDWTSLEQAIEKNRRKSVAKFLGVSEQVERTEHFWQPFWLGILKYSQSDGTIFKSGSIKQAAVLLDATSSQQVIVSIIEKDSSAFQIVQSAVSKRVMDRRLCLPPIIDECVAQKTLEGFVRSNPTFHNPQVTVQGVLYIPAVDVTYSSKEGSRNFVTCVLKNPNTQTSALRRATSSFVRRYAN